MTRPPNQRGDRPADPPLHPPARAPQAVPAGRSCALRRTGCWHATSAMSTRSSPPPVPISYVESGGVAV